MTSETGTPRTLADELRSWPDEALAELLRVRPDLLSPVPGDLTQLATRAGTRASVSRALEQLDQFALQTAQALAIAPDPCPRDALAALLPGGQAELPRALTALRAQAVIWGGDARLRLVRTARELLSPSSSNPSATGLGPSLAEAAVGMSPGRLQDILVSAGLPTTADPVTALAALAELLADKGKLTALLERAPAEATAMLDKLVWGPPYGEVSGSPSPPVRWLLDRGLLLPAGPRTVVLPREVALSLRDGHAHRLLEPTAPEVSVRREHPSRSVDLAAAGQAHAALGRVEELLKEWQRAAPAVLRAGGLGVRDLTRTAAALDVPEGEAAFWVELAYAAGLLASDGETDERYAPTPAYDTWREQRDHQRWARLLAAWLPATRVPGLAGGKDGKGRPLSALGPGLDRSPAPGIRLRVLRLLAALPSGAAPDTQTLAARLRWQRPLRASATLREQLFTATLAEAELLGVTGRGALASQVRELVEGPRAEQQTAVEQAADLLAPLLPEPLDHVLLQADLTAVAPGPLQRPLAETLEVLADIESKGGATVYRFTSASVRRALDAGRNPAELHAFLAAHSRTPVPQPLSYLIDDVARKHGQLRIGAASAYVRCEDDSLLAEILADKRSAPLGLRLLAPTVLAAQTDPSQLLVKLRELGYSPAAESAEGDVLITRADAHRTPPRSAPEPVPDGPPQPDTRLLTAAVRAIKAGDLAATAPHRQPKTPRQTPSGELPRSTSADVLATMQTAVLTGGTVWIGYVNADGAASQRVIAPIRVEGGFVTGYDHTADEVRTYPLHRITGAAELAAD